MTIRQFLWIAAVLVIGAQGLCFLTGLILDVWWSEKQAKKPPVYRARWKVPRAEVKHAQG